MSTTPNEPGTGGLDLPGSPAAPAAPAAPTYGPIGGVTAPRPLDPESQRLLDARPTGYGDEAGVTAVLTPTTAAPAGRRTPRVRTIVFALVLLAVAATVLVAAVTDVTVDGGAVLLVLLVAAGLALLGGGLAAAAKEARGGPGA
ncbi:hypothetical protein [Kineosporia sp. R_H_3]|uniref:hypothetical protein n=1 Tax=Kineosporia sp. R_H_3 TaxID=1961848 RepID=UPI000B4C0C9D|nr:hypothetical protein [Kineosporia sp. R_H_3]